MLDNSCEPILTKNANVLLCGKPCAAVFLQMKLYTAHLLLDLEGHPHHWRTDCILYRFCDFYKVSLRQSQLLDLLRVCYKSTRAEFQQNCIMQRAELKLTLAVPWRKGCRTKNKLNSKGACQKHMVWTAT